MVPKRRCSASVLLSWNQPLLRRKGLPQQKESAFAANSRRKLAALQAQLKEKELELAESQALVRESEGRLQAQIHDLQIQITEKQLLLETRNVEIAGLRNQIDCRLGAVGSV